MNVLLVHNFYQQPGGEDQVFADEAQLLRAHGDSVETFTVHNSQVEQIGKAQVAAKTIWNRETIATLAAAVRNHRADVVHFHNTFPLISPGAYQAVANEGAAVVQTLHNYRLLCPSATLYRDGHVCEDCVKKTIAWPAVKHACYRQSRAGSAVVAAMLTVHNARGTYQHDVDAYIALTEFSRQKFVEGGLPADRLFVKPNFVDPDPGIGNGEGDSNGPFALFVGRLTHEKGIPTLLEAWNEVGNFLPLKILGDGPLKAEVDAAAKSNPAIEYLGRRQMPEVLRLMGQANMLVFPSVWYEGLPRTIVESFAKGTPVIASRLGSMAELIQPGQNGYLFEAGSASALARTVMESAAMAEQLRVKTRSTFEEKYTATPNYETLRSIYQDAIRSAAARHSASAQPTASTADVHRRGSLATGSH